MLLVILDNVEVLVVQWTLLVAARMGSREGDVMSRLSLLLLVHHVFVLACRRVGKLVDVVSSEPLTFLSRPAPGPKSLASAERGPQQGGESSACAGARAPPPRRRQMQDAACRPAKDWTGRGHWGHWGHWGRLAC
ncbi:hypothetical protein THAOC_28968 [Thalassiosira oceanica]|uniref:Uncharacterized protein n=1 Tax=Thalassiosira oceanica TaxID=159749 RepID=K0RDM9_THAOC|nr:hypothetical protein THAOC_28968 [Thalassiosira oceanica]|eukprot:EJK51828.1 hypothetical protein THAOC_28968 [Thalassiosira oceanica]